MAGKVTAVTFVTFLMAPSSESSAPHPSQHHQDTWPGPALSTTCLLHSAALGHSFQRVPRHQWRPLWGKNPAPFPSSLGPSLARLSLSGLAAMRASLLPSCETSGPGAPSRASQPDPYAAGGGPQSGGMGRGMPWWFGGRKTRPSFGSNRGREEKVQSGVEPRPRQPQPRGQGPGERPAEGTGPHSMIFPGVAGTLTTHHLHLCSGASVWYCGGTHGWELGGLALS